MIYSQILVGIPTGNPTDVSVGDLLGPMDITAHFGDVPALGRSKVTKSQKQIKASQILQKTIIICFRDLLTFKNGDILALWTFRHGDEIALVDFSMGIFQHHGHSSKGTLQLWLPEK